MTSGDTRSRTPPFLGRLRLAGLLVVAGLALETLTLFWSHHLAFVLFLGVGGLAIVSGVLLFLVALVSPGRGEAAPGPASRSSRP